MSRLAEGVAFYLTHPRKIPRRIGAIHIGDRTLFEVSGGRLALRVYRAARLIVAIVGYIGPRPRVMLALWRSIQSLPYPPNELVKSIGSALAATNASSMSEFLFDGAAALLIRNKFALVPAIALLERAFADRPSPKIAMELTTVQRLANRHSDAVHTLLAAQQATPASRELWYESIIYAMRHGNASDTLALLERISLSDPGYPLAEFFNRVFRDYPQYIATLEASVAAARSPGKPAMLIGFSVWGKRYVFLLKHYTLASLLSENNLPRLSATHDVHIVIFTTDADADFLREDPLYDRMSRYATFHFITIAADMIEVTKLSDFPVAVHAQFGLMSSAHYAILECARRFKATAVVLGADNVVNESFLANIAAMVDQGASAVVAAGFRLPAQQSLDIVNQRYRAADGAISMSGEGFSLLLSECLPEACFVDADRFSRFPLFLCWRIDGEGILAHVNHLHPVLINGAYLRELRYPSIDPVDGRLLVRYLTDIDKIRIVDDNSVCLFDAAVNPLISPVDDAGKFDAREVGLWLWQFDDGLRARYASVPIRYQVGTTRSEIWGTIESAASETVKRVLDEMRDLERQNLGGGDGR